MRGLLSEKEIRDRGRYVRQTGQAQATLHSRTGQQKYGTQRKGELGKGPVVQSTPYIYCNTAVNPEINLLASPRGKNVIPSARINPPGWRGGTYHSSHTTFPEGVRKKDETRQPARKGQSKFQYRSKGGGYGTKTN